MRASNAKSGDLAVIYLKELHSTAEELGAKVVGVWAYASGHKFWYVVEAENAHVAAKVFSEAKIYHWNTAEVRPVIIHEEARETSMATR